MNFNEFYLILINLSNIKNIKDALDNEGYIALHLAVLSGSKLLKNYW